MTTATKLASTAVVAALVVASTTSAVAGEAEQTQQQPDLPAVEEVEAHLDDLYRADSSRAELTMEIVTERRQRELEMESWTRGEDNALFVIRSPAREAGTATLRTEDGLWNYAPRADRLVRIPTGMLSDDWMGSHLTNDDLVQETQYADDYDIELQWDEHDGERVLRAVMTPQEDAPVVYTRIDYLLDADEWTPMQGEYYEDEDLVRSMEFSNVREVDGRQVPHVMEVRPEDKPGEYTRMEYTELQFNVDVDEDIFTSRGLRRLAR